MYAMVYLLIQVSLDLWCSFLSRIDLLFQSLGDTVFQARYISYTIFELSIKSLVLFLDSFLEANNLIL
jgi:hypothetical protein